MHIYRTVDGYVKIETRWNQDHPERGIQQNLVISSSFWFSLILWICTKSNVDKKITNIDTNFLVE